MDNHKPTNQCRCKHHWYCEPNLRPISKAYCICCGAKAEFRNIVDPMEYKAFKVKESEPEYDFYSSFNKPLAH
jgi:hypothetical protein